MKIFDLKIDDVLIGFRIKDCYRPGVIGTIVERYSQYHFSILWDGEDSVRIYGARFYDNIANCEIINYEQMQKLKCFL